MKVRYWEDRSGAPRECDVAENRKLDLTVARVELVENVASREAIAFAIDNSIGVLTLTRDKGSYRPFRIEVEVKVFDGLLDQRVVAFTGTVDIIVNNAQGPAQIDVRGQGSGPPGSPWKTKKNRHEDLGISSHRDGWHVSAELKGVQGLEGHRVAVELRVNAPRAENQEVRASLASSTVASIELRTLTDNEDRSLNVLLAQATDVLLSPDSGHPIGSTPWLLGLKGVPAKGLLEWFKTSVLLPVLERTEERRATAISFLPEAVTTDQTLGTGTAWFIADGLPWATKSTSRFRLIGLETTDPLNVALQWPRLLGINGRALQASGKLALKMNWVTQPERGRFSAEIDVSPFDGDIRIGALDIRLDVPAGKRPLTLTDIAIRGWSLGSASTGDRATLERINLGLEGWPCLIRPGGVDELPESLVSSRAWRSDAGSSSGSDEQDIENFLRPSPPLVFAPQGETRKTNLSVDERWESGSRRHLSLALTSEESGIPLTAVVLDTEPLMLMRTRVDLGIGTDQREIANWSISEVEGTRWEIRSESPMSVVLPLQTVGEAIERGGRNADRSPEEQTLPYRFGESARLSIQTSYQSQRFSEPPWNWRRAFGYAGQRAPGAELKSARFELLYGLAATLDPAVSTQRYRVAEQQGRMGRWPDPPAHDAAAAPFTDEFLRYRKEWARFTQAYRRRLGVLDVYAEGRQVANAADDPRALATAPTLISDGLTLELRKTADIAYPIPSDLRTEADNVAIQRWYGARDEAKGLKGGAGYGVESSALYRRLLSAPTSNAASVEGLAFSALGGWGDQRGAFDNRRTRIVSKTEQGRVSAYSIERVGRIGALWNRAKHVIVYERTVARTARYEKDQNDHIGRALIRKVDEYIEILQPRRDYPDAVGASRMPSGFVKAVEFVSHRISVDSSWARDLEDGWEIPLWKETKKFPKPDVRFVFSGDPQQSIPEVIQAIDNPENLYFYTTTDEGLSDDTDRWPAVLDVDYTIRPLPGALSEPALSDAPRNPSGADPKDLPELGLEPAVPIGFERFTFRLQRGGAPVNLVEARANACIAARVDTVTFQRPGAQTLDPSRASTMKLLALWAEGIKVIDEQKGDERRREFISTTIAAQINRSKNSGELVALSTALKSFDPCKAAIGVIDESVRRLQSQWIRRVEHECESLIQRANRLDQSNLEKFRSEIRDAVSEVCKAVSAGFRAVNALAGRFDLASGEFNNSLAIASHDLKKFIGAVAHELSAFKEIVSTLASTLQKHQESIPKPIFYGASAALVEAKKAADSQKAIEAAKALDLVLSEIIAYQTSLSEALSNKAKELETSFQSAEEKINGEIERVSASLSSEAIVHLFREIQETLSDVIRNSCESLGTSAKGVVNTQCSTGVFKKLKDLVTQTLDPEKLHAIQDSYQAMVSALSILEEDWRSSAAANAPSLRSPSETLRLIRALGEGPVLPQMRFNRNRLAYFFDDYLAEVRCSPVAALVDRVGGDLKAFGIRLPTAGLAERLLPARLPDFSIGDVFPYFGALRLGIKDKLTQLAEKGIHIDQGFDKATQVAWMRADVDVPLGESIVVFQQGPMTLRLLNARLIGTASLQTGIDGRVQKVSEGKVVGTWKMLFGGAHVVSFVDTTLAFDRNGRFSFNIHADRILLDEVLAWLKGAIVSLGDEDSGFKVDLIESEGRPVGVAANLNLALPPYSAGAVSLAGVQLGALMGVSAANGTFVVQSGFTLSTRDQPFTLVIGFLGGSGFLESWVKYKPDDGHAEGYLRIGLMAAAGAAFNAGWARGSVFFRLGMEVEYRFGASQGSGLALALVVEMSGRLSMKVVTVDVTVRLAIVRDASGAMTGVGTLAVRVRLSRFYTFRVNRSVTRSLARGGSSAPAVLTSAGMGHSRGNSVSSNASGLARARAQARFANFE